MKRFIGLTFALLLGLSSFAFALTNETEADVGDPYQTGTGTHTTSSGSTCNCALSDAPMVIDKSKLEDLRWLEDVKAGPAQPTPGAPAQGTDAPGN